MYNDKSLAQWLLIITMAILIAEFTTSTFTFGFRQCSVVLTCVTVVMLSWTCLTLVVDLYCPFHSSLCQCSLVVYFCRKIYGKTAVLFITCV